VTMSIGQTSAPQQNSDVVMEEANPAGNQDMSNKHNGYGIASQQTIGILFPKQAPAAPFSSSTSEFILRNRNWGPLTMQFSYCHRSLELDGDDVCEPILHSG
jgi:hypothetical protein